MAISLVGTTTADYTATSPAAQAVTLPSGWTAGDLILLFVPQGVATGSTTVTWTGATQVGNSLGGSDMFTSLWWKIAGASESPTFSTSDASSRSSVVVAAYRGVDQTTPIDTTVGFVDSPAGATHTVPSQTVSANAWLVSLAAIDGSAGSTSPQFTQPSGWTERLDFRNNNSDHYLAALADTGPLTAGTKSGHTWGTVYTDRAVNVTVVALREASASVTATLAATATVTATGVLGPTLNQRFVGIGKVKVKTTNADSVRLKIGTDTAVTTGVTYTSAQTPDAQGYTVHDVSGLATASTFYYRVAMTAGGEVLDAESTVGRIRTQATGGFAFCFGSCSDGDSAAMTAIANRADDLFLHMGDFIYADGSGTSLANFRSKWDTFLTQTNHAKVFATTPTTLGPSDHDGMNNNWVGTGDTTARDNLNTVLREKTAQVPVPSTTGTYFTFEWGPVCFIVTDGRSFKSANAATDDSSKTVLGATQKQWVKDTAAATTKRVVIIVGDTPLTGAANVDDDEWNNYNTERQDLFGYLAGLAPTKRVAYLHGDMHALGADDGTNDGVTGASIPSFCGAPLHQAFSFKAGPYTAGTYPTSGTVDQYGRIVVSETATSVTLAYTGYSSDNTARITQTTVFDFPLTATATQAATSSVTTTGVVGKATSATVAATSSTSSTGVVGKVTTAALAAVASLAAAGIVGTAATTTIAETGTVSSSGGVGTSTTSAIAGTASVTATGVVDRATTTALSSTATVTAAGTVVSGGSASATLAATSAITATGVVGTAATATSTSTAAVTTTEVVTGGRTAALGATGTLSATGVVGTSAAASIASTGAAAAAGAVTAGQTATLAGAASITAAGQVAATSIASIASTAQLLASGQLAVGRASTLAATATITASGMLGELQTPLERTLVVERESRTLLVQAEDRRTVIPRETRRMEA